MRLSSPCAAPGSSSPSQTVPPKASSLHFEFVPEEGAASAGSRRVTVSLPAVHQLLEGDDEILEQLVRRYSVPERLRCASSRMELCGGRGVLCARYGLCWRRYPHSYTPPH